MHEVTKQWCKRRCIGRFRAKRVESRVLCALQIGLASRRGMGDEDGPGCIRVRTKTGRDFQPRHVGHPNIQQNDFRLASRGRVDSDATAVDGIGIEAADGQHHADGVGGIHVIVDDEHARRAGRGLRSAGPDRAFRYQLVACGSHERFAQR